MVPSFGAEDELREAMLKAREAGSLQAEASSQKQIRVTDGQLFHFFIVWILECVGVEIS